MFFCIILRERNFCGFDGPVNNSKFFLKAFLSVEISVVLIDKNLVYQYLFFLCKIRVSPVLQDAVNNSKFFLKAFLSVEISVVLIDKNLVYQHLFFLCKIRVSRATGCSIKAKKTHRSNSNARQNFLRQNYLHSQAQFPPNCF